MGVRFPREQPRAHFYSGAHQSTLLILEMILHTLIAIVALKAMKIREFESWENKQKIEKFEILKIFNFFLIFKQLYFLGFLS